MYRIFAFVLLFFGFALLSTDYRRGSFDFWADYIMAGIFWLLIGFQLLKNLWEFKQ